MEKVKDLDSSNWAFMRKGVKIKKKKKKVKSLRKTEGTGQYANFILMQASLGQVLQNRRRNCLWKAPQ